MVLRKVRRCGCDVVLREVRRSEHQRDQKMSSHLLKGGMWHQGRWNQEWAVPSEDVEALAEARARKCLVEE